MPQVALSRQYSLSEIEEALRQVVASPGFDLSVTKDYSSKRHGPLRDAARLQLLATWARGSRGKRLAFDPENSAETVLDRWCDYAPGIVALRMSDGIVIGDEVTERRDTLLPAAQKFEKTDELRLDAVVKGRTLDFPIVGGAKRQYLAALFSSRSSHAVKGVQGMADMLRRLGLHVGKKDARRIEPRFWDACAVFASELIKNTQEHATTDANGVPYMEHVEGLIVGWKEMSDTIFHGDFRGHSELDEFWHREKIDLGQGETGLRTLQMSFFDTGPGFFARLTGEYAPAMDVRVERETVLAGLRKNATSKRETGAGNGIPEVMEKLREIGGLISIRTGRLHIFRAFAPGEEGDAFAFQDWSDADLANAAGSVVSILVPIRRV